MLLLLDKHTYAYTGFAFKMVQTPQAILEIQELGGTCIIVHSMHVWCIYYARSYHLNIVSGLCAGSDKIRPYWDRYFSGHAALVSNMYVHVHV